MTVGWMPRARGRAFAARARPPARGAPPKGAGGGGGVFWKGDSAAVHASLTEGGRGAADPVPAGLVDGRLPGGLAGAAGGGCRGVVADDDHAADRRGGTGLQGVSAAGPGRSRLRVRLGR